MVYVRRSQLLEHEGSVVSKKMVRFALAVLLMALGAGACASGCGSSEVASVCDVVCFCRQCTDLDRAECEDEGERSRALASERGCDSQFNVYTACLQDGDQVRCDGTRATTESCAAELSVLKKCTQVDEPPFDSSTGAGGG
jgi:hypothetical protein